MKNIVCFFYSSSADFLDLVFFFFLLVIVFVLKRHKLSLTLLKNLQLIVCFSRDDNERKKAITSGTTWKSENETSLKMTETFSLKKNIKQLGYAT